MAQILLRWKNSTLLDQGVIPKGNVRAEVGKHKLAETRRQVESGWRSLAINLAEDGHKDLARDVQRFVDRMPRREQNAS